MSLGEMTEERFNQLLDVNKHPAGCIWGGFSCGYWMVVDGCDLEHWEKHYVGVDGTCPCGTLYPGASSEVIYFDANSAPYG